MKKPAGASAYRFWRWGNFAMLLATRRASSIVSTLAVSASAIG